VSNNNNKFAIVNFNSVTVDFQINIRIRQVCKINKNENLLLK